MQPVIGNLRTDGGTWPEYNVTFDKLDAGVGAKIRRGAPAIWAHIRGEVAQWFNAAR